MSPAICDSLFAKAFVTTIERVLHDSSKWVGVARHAWKPALESAALILSVTNGLALLRNYWRDKPKLSVRAIHPDVYQWWFPLPGGVHDGSPTRAYGFLVYIGIANSGLRKVALESWRLAVKNQLWRTISLEPLSIPDVEFAIGDCRKFLPILGQSGVVLPGNTVVDAGCTISGVAFYRYECWGGAGSDPKQAHGQIQAVFTAVDVFGGKTSMKLRLSMKPVESIQKFAPGFIESIQKIHKSAGAENDNPEALD